MSATPAELPEDVARAMSRPANRLGKYVLLEELGRGGMGRVYRAWDPSLGRAVAIKLLLFHEPEDLLRFRQEAHLAAALDHPGIVQVHEMGEAEGRLFIAMQYVDGRSLEGGARLPLRKAAETIRDAARAIAFAHERGVIHRDLKPGNLLLARDGRVRVTDFGLAKRSDARSLSGTAVGTPSYMSPEQAAGRASAVGPRSDVYALGATLYGILAGRPPFTGADVLSVLRAVVTEDPPALRRLNPRVPWELETVTLKAMEKDPARRYASASELAEDLDRYLQGEAVWARRPGGLTRLRRFAKRRRAFLGAAGAFLAAAALGAAVFVPSWRDERRAKERAEAEVHTLRGLGTLWTQVVLAKQGFHVEASDPGRVAARIRELVGRVGAFVAANPKLPQGYYVRAQARLYVGETREAEGDLRRALEADPGFAPGLVLLGRLKLEEHSWRIYGLPDPGHKGARQAAAAPLVEEAGKLLAEGLKRGSEGAAPERWGLVRTREDDVALVVAQALQARFLRGDLGAAVRLLEEAQAKEGAAEYCNWLGLLSGPGLNVEWQTRALKHMPHFPKAYLDRGEARLRRDDLEGALRDFARAVELRPDLAVARANLGGALLLQGDAGRAFDELTRALELDAGHVLAWANRAIARLRRQDPAGAEEDASRAIALAPAHPEAYATRGRARAAKGDLAGALLDYAKATELNPGDVDALQFRGVLRLELSRAEPARRGEHRAAGARDLEEALRFAPPGWGLRAQTEELLRRARAP
jgi:tetratricopeptide (TPR) repeat protein